MKTRRSDRLIDMTRYLLERPHTLVPLTFFSQRYESAKSSISEDLAIIRRTFAQRHTGILETVPGTAGGVRYVPIIAATEAQTFISQIAERLSDSERLLPGGYVYLTDLLGTPEVLRQIGRLIATQYIDSSVDAVMTVATKGIPIAQSVSQYLNVPFVIVRRDSKITEGSTVSVNYVSGSSDRVQKMELSKRSLKPGSGVLIVDDFMKGGGTVGGMKSLIEEFDAKLLGVSVFAEGDFNGDRLIDDYTSLLRINQVDSKTKTITAEAGNYLQRNAELLTGLDK